MKSADLVWAELEANVDSLIVILNEKLLEVLGDDVHAGPGLRPLANDVLKNARRRRHQRHHPHAPAS